MSGDEIFVLIASLIITFVGFGYWFSCLTSIWPKGRAKNQRIWMAVLPLVCMFLILIVLRTLASFDVITDGIYIFFYIVMGLAWLVAGKLMMFVFLDISWRDDAIERDNLAAFFAVFGGMIGLTAIYSGANIGDGPGWWTVVWAGGIGSLAWFVLIAIINKFTNVLEKITIGRDYAAGLRMAFFMVASGIVLGRGSAGDWTSAGQTVREFVDAWPVLILVIGAIIIERGHNRADTEDYKPYSWSYGAIVIGIIYLVIAVAAILAMPPIPQNSIYDNIWGGI